MNYSVFSDYKKTVYAQSNDNKLSVELRPIRVIRVLIRKNTEPNSYHDEWYRLSQVKNLYKSVQPASLVMSLSKYPRSNVVCIFTHDAFFTGDTLLNNSKTPLTFPRSNLNDYANAIQKIKPLLKPGMTIYPGHGEAFVVNENFLERFGIWVLLFEIFENSGHGEAFVFGEWFLQWFEIWVLLFEFCYLSFVIWDFWISRPWGVFCGEHLF